MVGCDEEEVEEWEGMAVPVRPLVGWTGRMISVWGRLRGGERVVHAGLREGLTLDHLERNQMCMRFFL